MSRHKDAALIFANHALLADGWASDVRINVTDGRISDVVANEVRVPGDVAVPVLLPALSNLHSHTFQRAMAGLTERRQAGQDSFWTWRDLMYRFMDRLTPEHIEAIAALAFMEMQEAGFAAVAEFHYVHHQQGGVPYANPAELSERIFAAAATTGIGLTHLPVLYTYGGAGRQALGERQKRFGNPPDQFAALVDAIGRALTDLPVDTRLGIAPHSLRATSPEDLAQVFPLARGGPIHMHIAEQPKEVADVQDWLGARPVDWLLDHVPVGPGWCLIHATHMTAGETERLAKTGAVAGLCPVTEANLGDGPFNGPLWLAVGGRFGVGTDSNVRISMIEELRTLEYSQRLRDLARNVMTTGEDSVGTFLYQNAAKGGAQALGRKAGQIVVGHLADLVAINVDDPSLCALPRDRLLDGLVFAGDARLITDVWSAGRHMVREGRHILRESIVDGWQQAVSTLRGAM
jgi:formimidoylglutamate deiminase